MKQTFLGIALLIMVGCSSTPTLQTGPNAEVSHDGLVRVNNTRVDAAWIRPGIDMSSYDSVMLFGAGVNYRSVRETNRLNYTSASEFPMDERQKGVVEEAAREAFFEALQGSDRYQVAEEVGPNTLALAGQLNDVVSFVPEEPVGRVDFYLSELGAATLILELRDSMSGQTVARAVDSRSIDVDFVQRANRVSNRFELDREFEQWADTIREALESLLSVPILPAE